MRQIFLFIFNVHSNICVVKKKKERIVIIRSNLNAILYNDHVLIRLYRSQLIAHA
jgi:hypothetical protein